jgi:hypothetical protein
VLANVATKALYGPAGTGGRAVERVIGRSLDRDQYPLADSPEVLCRYRQLETPEAAVVMSERDMVRFNRGLALGGSCGAADRPHVGADGLVALYPQDLAVAQQLVRFGWTRHGPWSRSPPTPAARAMPRSPPVSGRASPRSSTTRAGRGC